MRVTNVTFLDRDNLNAAPRPCTICGAMLSRYNKTDRCFHHTDAETPQKTSVSAGHAIEKTSSGIPEELVVRTEELTPEGIVAAVCKVCRVSREEIFSATRKAQIVKARHVLMYLLRIDGQLSLPKIGKLLARDHATILHAVKKVRAALREDTAIQNIVQRVQAYYRVS